MKMPARPSACVWATFDIVVIISKEGNGVKVIPGEQHSVTTTEILQLSESLRKFRLADSGASQT